MVDEQNEEKMKKIQDGLLYDTETATCVAEVNNGYGQEHFRYWEEELYRTDNGRWFVRKAGGGGSPYGGKRDNYLIAGELIEVLDEVEAKSWLEKHNRIRAYEKYFGNEIKEA